MESTRGQPTGPTSPKQPCGAHMGSARLSTPLRLYIVPDQKQTEDESASAMQSGAPQNIVFVVRIHEELNYKQYVYTSS